MFSKLTTYLQHVVLRQSEIRDSLQRIEQRLGTLERMAHGGRATYIGNNRVLTKTVVNGANFAFMVEADDLLLSPWFIAAGAYETELTDFFLNHVRSGHHCIDAGSNFGYFACLFARLAAKGKVIAIEADEHVHRLCRDNIYANGLQDVATALHAAVNADGADLTLYRRIGRSGNTSVIAASKAATDHYGEPPVEPFTVKGVTIDQLLPRLDGRVDFIKIDIEGAEPAAFQGMRRTVETNPAIKIVMEWSPGQISAAGTAPADFLDQLAGLGLTCHDLTTQELLSKEQVLERAYSAGILLARSL